MTIGPEDLAALDRAHQPTPAEVERYVRLAVAPRRRSLRGLALLSVPVALAAAWLLWPRAVQGPLTPSETWFEVRPGLTARGGGQGEVVGEGELAWVDGRVEVSLDPGTGPLVVRTDEALVRVVGTVFTVDRDGYGTTVAVSRGEVHVTCIGGPEQAVGVGDAAVCPKDAGSALAIANRATDGRVRRRAAQRGLQQDPSDPVRQALLAVAVAGALADGERGGAAILARDLDPRLPASRSALRAVVGEAPGCDSDPAVLGALDLLSTVDAGAAIELARCAADPSEARRILVRARPAVGPTEQAALDAWLGSLPPR